MRRSFRFGPGFFVLGLAGCHGASVRGSPPQEGSAAPVVAAPLDTSWEREPGRLLAAGDGAPDFEGIAHTGMRVKLSSFCEPRAIVFFYAGDRSPDGEAQTRAFRDAWMRLRERIQMVIGVSSDDRVTHADFATREELPFLLVADEDGKIRKAFGIAPGASAAFVVGKDLRIVRALSGTTEPFATTILAALETLGT